MKCPHCKNEDPDLLERLTATVWRCDVCSKNFPATFGRRPDGPPFDTREERRGEK